MATIFRTRGVFRTAGTGPDCLITNYWDSTGAAPVALATESLARVRAGFNAAAAILVAGSSFVQNPVVDEIEETTGALVNQVIGVPGAAVVFTAAGNWLPIQTQFVVTKQTALFRFGKRVRGRQYIPGWTANSVTVAGVPTVAANNAMVAFNTALGTTVVTATNERVWSRPNTPLGRAGLSAVVSSRGINANWTVLRSRRR